MKVLVVENDPILLAMLAIRLGRHGFDVQTETEVPAIFDADVVVMDGHLDGGLAFSEIAQLVNAGQTVIVFSGMNGPDEKRVKAMGIRAWIPKPRIDQLMEALAEVRAERGRG